MGTRVLEWWNITADWVKSIPLSPLAFVLWTAISLGTAQFLLLQRQRIPYISR